MDKLSERLVAEAATWPVDAASGGPHKLRALLAEAAKLARRVEEAPVVPVYFERLSEGEFFADIEAGRIPCALAGQRVRLVREE